MPEAREAPGAGEIGNNWNDDAAQGKPALRHGTYDETFALGTGGNARIARKARTDGGQPALRVRGDVDEAGEGPHAGEKTNSGGTGAPVLVPGLKALTPPAMTPVTVGQATVVVITIQKRKLII